VTYDIIIKNVYFFPITVSNLLKEKKRFFISVYAIF
jgi:hypothetical protein